MFRPIAIATPRAYLRLCSNKLCSETAPPEKMTHVDSEGKAKMVDVGSKRVTARTAVACAR